nr:acetyl-CoA carboxylase biotin carboxyl carrier protein subunit [uncultured Cupriavidus sp.]
MENQTNTVPIVAETTGTLWKIVAQPHAEVGQDETLVIIESMKMEIPVEALAEGFVVEYSVAEGDPVEDGQVIGTFQLSS